MIHEYTAEAGAALPPTDDTATAQPPSSPRTEAFAHLSLRQLVASLTNPRTTFSPAKLQELADSIAASGVHQPVLVRPLPGLRVGDTDRHVQYEIVAGERRFRACQLAGLDSIPALVRAMTDREVLEAQIVENLQRADLSELEEAEGYDRLMRHSELNADAVAGKIGKSRSYVYARLKLLDLSGECRAALADGRIDASRALLIARIPDGKLQLKAMQYAAGEQGNGGQAEPPSVRALQIWLQQNVMLPLERAPFQITDARLVEAAGSCKSCPKRTGANPDIFADVSSADICTDPPCYNSKSEAHDLRNMARAEAKSMRLVTGAEARAICYEKSSTLNGYSRLSQVREDAGGERLDKLLGKDFKGAVLIDNPYTHELIEAAPTEEAEAVLLARGLVKAVQPERQEQPDDQSAGASIDEKMRQQSEKILEKQIEELKNSTQREIEKQFRQEAYELIANRVRNTPAALASALITPQLLRAWLISHLDNWPAADLADVLQMTLDKDQQESQHEETVRLRLQSADATTVFGAAVLFMMADDRDIPYQFQQPNPTPVFSAAAADKCIDLPTLRKTIEKDVKTRISGEIAALKAQLKPPKTSAPTAPLAQPALAPNTAAKPGKAQAVPASLRKPKLSAQEAISGIAEAMQGIEPGQVPCPAAPGGQSAQAQTQGLQVNGAAEQSALCLGFAIGQRVQVLPNVSARHSKWIGKQGTVTAKMGDCAWDVTFRGRNGGLASFDSGELEVIES